MQADQSATWQNPKVITTLLFVFIAGAFTGALGMRLGLHERLHPTGGGSTLSNSPNAAKAFLNRCKKDLELSPKQADEMATILDDYKLYYQSLQDQLEEVRATGKSRIMSLLDARQRSKFEKMLTEIPR